MHWSKTIKFGKNVIQTAGFFQLYRVEYTPKEIEEYRLKHFPNNSIKIGRVKAVRAISGQSIKDSKIFVELSFEDNGNGDIIK